MVSKMWVKQILEMNLVNLQLSATRMNVFAIQLETFIFSVFIRK